jgi:conjugative transfer signal peptidase TraF
MAMVAVVPFATAVGGLRVNYTRSLPLGLYRATRERLFAHGSVVLACLPTNVARFARERGYVWRGHCSGSAPPIGKLIFAIEGDTVGVSASGLSLNGKLVPHTEALPVDSRGRPMVRYPIGTYVVHRDEVWLYSPHHRLSFDSRYFGPIASSSIIAILRPLWTTELR